LASAASSVMASFSSDASVGAPPRDVAAKSATPRANPAPARALPLDPGSSGGDWGRGCGLRRVGVLLGGAHAERGGAVGAGRPADRRDSVRPRRDRGAGRDARGAG
jgi:hypothetical protein